jgi:hypothetical protein
VHDRHDHPQDQRGGAEQAEVAEELEQRGVAGERRAAAGAQQDHREDPERAPERGQHDPVYQLGIMASGGSDGQSAWPPALPWRTGGVKRFPDRSHAGPSGNA